MAEIGTIPKSLSFIFLILLNGFLLSAQHNYPLTKVGIWVSEEQLSSLYTLYAMPLIIINTTVYIPNERCIELRKYGGSISNKDFEGNTITKSEGSDSAEKSAGSNTVEKETGGTGDQKSQAAAEAAKSKGGGKAKKSRGAANEKKDHSGTIVERQEDGDLAIRSGSGADDDRQGSGAEAEKQTAGALDTRNTAAGTDQKSYNGYTLFIKCYKEGSMFSLADFFGEGKIKIYDVNGLHEVTILNIIYD
ncbi:MAG: hypothetical protein ABI761_13015 [Saprospiraceae bacterium]